MHMEFSALLISTNPRTWEPWVMLGAQYQALHQYGTRVVHLHVLLYLDTPLEWALTIISAFAIGTGSFYWG
jgi:hypothetical protein